jgi:DNA-binding IclR family transcriptional regulator
MRLFPLAVVDEDRPLSVSQLARWLGLGLSTASRIVGQLGRAFLVA